MSAVAEPVSFGTGVPTSAAARTWRRLKRDRLALGSGLVIVFVFLLCFVVEPIAERLLGHGPNTLFPYASSDPYEFRPAGLWAHVPDVHATGTVTASTPRTLLVLGADGPLGRDEFLRLLAGGRTSLEIALGATVLAVLIGTTLGAVAGFFGGWLDWTISRVTEFVMGFPILFFVVVVGLTQLSTKLDHVTVHGLVVRGVVVLVVLIGLFNWFYIARIVRAQVLSLRHQEFVEAARMIGASDWYIVRKHVFPHLVGSIVVYGSLVVATTMVLEAALSFIGLGIELPDASWGNMLSQKWGTLLLPATQIPQPETVHTSTWLFVWPTAAVFVTVFAFALFGEGLRRAFDPHGSE